MTPSPRIEPGSKASALTTAPSLLRIVELQEKYNLTLYFVPFAVLGLRQEKGKSVERRSKAQVVRYRQQLVKPSEDQLYQGNVFIPSQGI